MIEITFSFSLALFKFKFLLQMIFIRSRAHFFIAFQAEKFRICVFLLPAITLKGGLKLK
jgi:hypothetical protein